MEHQTMNSQNNKIELSQIEGISGLGGWLILVQIGLFGTLFSTFFYLLSLLYMMFNGTWQEITSYPYDIVWRNLLWYDLVTSLFIFFGGVIILYFFYGKKKVLPKLMIIYYGINFTVILVGYLMFQSNAAVQEAELGYLLRDVIRFTISCLIWIPYFIRSQRVKNTFVQ